MEANSEAIEEVNQENMDSTKEITCAFDRSHKMSSRRYQWHLMKCKAYDEKVMTREPIITTMSEEEATKLWNDEDYQTRKEENEADVEEWNKYASWGEEELNENKEEKKSNIYEGYYDPINIEELKQAIESEEINKKFNDLKFDDSSDSSDNE